MSNPYIPDGSIVAYSNYYSAVADAEPHPDLPKRGECNHFLPLDGWSYETESIGQGKNMEIAVVWSCTCKCGVTTTRTEWK